MKRRQHQAVNNQKAAQNGVYDTSALAFQRNGACLSAKSSRRFGERQVTFRRKASGISAKSQQRFGDIPKLRRAYFGLALHKLLRINCLFELLQNRLFQTERGSCKLECDSQSDLTRKKMTLRPIDREVQKYGSSEVQSLPK